MLLRQRDLFLIRVRHSGLMEKLIPGYFIHTLDLTDSTNLECRKMAENGSDEGLIVQALSQSSGRGRRGRSWSSPKGNLYFSMLIKPECKIGKALGISFLSAVAMCDALGAILPPMVEVRVKWPNDVLINQRKCCGFLLESSSDNCGNVNWVIIGTGVNVESFPENVDYPATSLSFEGSPNLELRTVLLSFVRHFKRWRNVWEEEGFNPIRKAWIDRSIGIGEKITARLAEVSYTGIFSDLTADGALVMITDEGREVVVTSGDIFPEFKV